MRISDWSSDVCSSDLRVVVVTAHDSGYRAAQELKAAGVEVVAIADIRSRPAPTGEAESAELRVLCGVTIEGTTGKLRVSSITITAEGRRHVFACDAVLMAGGFTPRVPLFSQSRGKLEGGDRKSTRLHSSP